MRSIFISMLVFIWLPLILFKPQVGVLVWSWLSHMNPHRLTYGFAYDFPFLNFVGLATIVGLFLSKDQIKLKAHPILIAMGVYFLWTIFTSVFGFGWEVSKVKLILFSKILIFAFVSVLVMRSPNRLKAYVYVMALSLAFVAVKGGIYTIFTGGSGRVQGAGGMIDDNNQLAMALSMMVPLAVWFVRHPPIEILRWPLIGVAGTFVLSVLGTHSRGGLAALAAVTAFMLVKSKRKWAIAALLVPMAMGAYAYMPDNWRARMATIETASEDDSFQGRVSMWKFSSNLTAEHPIEGGGFRVFEMARPIDLYMPIGFQPRAPHSIYFEVLGEHGYLGLILFLTMLFTGWYAGGVAARRYRAYKETIWLGDLAWAIQLGLVGYAVGGLTVNIATFDLFYHFLAVLVMIDRVGAHIVESGATPLDQTIESEDRRGPDGRWRPDGWSAPKEPS